MYRRPFAHQFIYGKKTIGGDARSIAGVRSTGGSDRALQQQRKCPLLLHGRALRQTLRADKILRATAAYNRIGVLENWEGAVHHRLSEAERQKHGARTSDQVLEGTIRKHQRATQRKSKAQPHNRTPSSITTCLSSEPRLNAF